MGWKLDPSSISAARGRRRYASRLVRLGLALGLSFLVATPGTGAERLPGPVSATVVRVIDGDTVLVRAKIWLGQQVETLVRLSGVDTPELRGACAAERELAARARDFVAARLVDGQVKLSEIEYGKYSGRVVARLQTPAGEDLGRELIAAGLGRPYDGGGRAAWCAGDELATD